MANSIDSTDSGEIGFPKIDGGQNKLPPIDTDDSKERKKKAPKKSESNSPKDGRSAEKKRKDKILRRLVKRFERCVKAESDNRAAALEDRKFTAGDQWPADVMATRKEDKRPCLTVNKLPTFIHQITNDQRQNRPSINVSPVGDKGDVEAAKMYRGVIRYLERASGADIAYDTAYSDSVTSGVGYFRILTERESPKTFDQTIVWRRIRNPFTVYLDPDHQEPDGADCKFGFVSELIPKEEFEDQWPDASVMPFVASGAGENKNWVDSDNIRIVEYYEITNETKTLVALSNGWIGFKDEILPETQALMDSGQLIIDREEESQVPSCTWYKATQIEILEETPWLGRWIPIVKVIGDEIDIEGKVKYSGVVRHAKDAQRMVNYWTCLALDTPIPTPSGWTTMAKIREGDRVFDETGAIVNVVGTSPVRIARPCFRVTFDDGSSIVADDTHLWSVEDRGKRKTNGDEWLRKILPTKDLVPGTHFVDVAKPLALPAADLPIPPYALGVWLGDGTTSEPNFSMCNADMAEASQHLIDAGCTLGPVKVGRTCENRTITGLRSRFTALKLLGDKHVPEMYLRASADQRLAVIQGMMDTDGNITPQGQCSFTTCDEKIADGFSELLRSVGLKSVRLVRNRNGRSIASNDGVYYYPTKTIYQFSFTAYVRMPVFKLSRKVQRLGLRGEEPRRTKRFAIRSIETVASVPVKCIKVDSASHLFLAGISMIPTHNTSEAEQLGLAPKAPFIMEEGQVEGHEQQWKQANTKAYPYLLYKAVNLGGKPAPPPQRQPPIPVPAGVVNAKQGAAQDMMATTGIRFDATLQERTVDESGRALREIRRSGDIGSFHYVDNLSRSLKHAGEIVLDLIPKILDTKRIMTILREDDTEEQVTLDPNAAKAVTESKHPETGKTQRIFNPTVGKFGVTVTIGPSYATKRIEAAESMMDFARALPNTAQMIADLIAKNQDWPGADEMARRLAKAVPPQLLTPDQKDVPPQMAALMQSMDLQIKQMTMERQQMLKALTDQQQDRAMEQDKINKDFEAKLLAIVQKAEAAFNKDVSGKVDMLVDTVNALMEGLGSPAPAGQTAPTG